ncbi:MAG: hypothetical protein ABSF92_11590 [Candidatus Acidiferrales bacterium]|jgi:hypothetical protein
MKAMQCQELEQLLEKSGDETLPTGAVAHLENCPACRNLFADLESIAAVARELPREIEPPQRIWTSLRAQLVAEGIIREKPQAAGWRESFRAFFARPALAFGAVGLLILAGALVVWRTGPRTPVPDQARFDSRPVLTAAGDTLEAEERGVTANFTLTDSKVDHSLRQNLAIVDDFIAACEKRVQEEPDNDLAKEYLSTAYQQKAELLATMMDRSGGGN